MDTHDFQRPVKVPRELVVALGIVRGDPYCEEYYLYGWIAWMIDWCKKNGFSAAAQWIEEDQRRYSHMLMVGYEIDEDKK